MELDNLQTDLLIIGGGINGAGVAASAASRGLSVILCEQGDLACATSSWSSKLIHGGLRDLEQYEFKLVRESLREREILLQRAPHLVQPITFVLPHESHLRPKWMIRIGLFLYDHLAKRTKLKGSKKLNLTTSLEGKPLKDNLTTGFSYSDCKTNDSRLVILNAQDAKENGATILTQTSLISAKRIDGFWQAEIYNKIANKKITVKAKALINATGPWVSHVLQELLGQAENNTMKPIKGSHIVVNKFYDGNHAYILQNKDNRVVFVIPFEEKYLLIGTTDIPYSGDLYQPIITEEESDYLCQIVNDYFTQQISSDDIVWSYAGVRPLYYKEKAKAQDITREYHLDINTENSTVPLISLYGGKLTTYRALSEDVVNQLMPYFSNMKAQADSNKPLPGGDFSNSSPNELKKELKNQYPWLEQNVINHYVNNYGQFAKKILGEAKSKTDLGIEFANGVYQCEIDYLIKHEWAIHIDDIIWRRTKYGLTLTESQQEKIKNYLSLTKSIHG